jgi:hypothetical protein
MYIYIHISTPRQCVFFIYTYTCIDICLIYDYVYKYTYSLLWINTYIYIYIYIYMYIYTCINTPGNVFSYIPIHVLIFRHMIYMYKYIKRTFACIWYTDIYKYTYIHAYLYTSILLKINVFPISRISDLRGTGSRPLMFSWDSLIFCVRASICIYVIYEFVCIYRYINKYMYIFL